VLVQFSVLVAVLLGIAALASDLGLIRATQASMQNAADAGALEGARWTDAIADDPRRQFAKDAIKRTYDLDAKVNVDSGADEYFTEARGLGAGPVVQVFATGGVHGAGGLAPSSIGQYKPNPQPNSENAQHGDLVAGVFDDEADASLEFGNYSRTDFAPVSASESQGARSFLARLRRTHNPQGLDAIPGVSNTGGGVPILFGLGPLTLPNTGAAYDVRRDGVTVRATAIAEAQPALQVGPRSYRNTQSNPASDLAPYGYLVIGRQLVTEQVIGLPGATGYESGLVTPVVDSVWWASQTPSAAFTLYAFEDGTLRSTTSPIGAGSESRGWVLRISDKDVVPSTSGSGAAYMAIGTDHTSVLEVGRILYPDPFPAWYLPTPPTQAQINLLSNGQKMRYQVDEPLCAPDDTPPASEGELMDEDLVFVAIARETTIAGYEPAKQIVGFIACECIEVPVFTPRQNSPFVPAHTRLVLQPRADYVFPANASALSRHGRAALASDASLRAAFESLGANRPLAPVLVR
jgi:hypothetical protein